MKRCRTQSINRCQLLELPSPLLCDILSRLTVETILSCKCVCKTFLEILTDPHFVKLHLIKAPNIDYGMIIVERDDLSNLLIAYNYTHELEKPEFDLTNLSSRPCQTLPAPSIASQFYNNCFNIVGACNGLICICYKNARFQKVYYICNPILGEFFALPLHDECQIIEHSGFGFCPKTNQYKVIRFIYPNKYCTVCTVGTDHCWRKIDNLPVPLTLRSMDCSLNGNLHWITSYTEVSNLICSFNLETEQVSFIPPPAHFTQDFRNEVFYIEMGLFDGYLCLNYQIGGKYEVFVMKDYGAKKGGCWTKEISVDLMSNFDLQWCSSSIVVNFLNNGDLILQCDFHTLICCNLRKRTTRCLIAEQLLSYNVVPFVPSFISLKEMAADAGGDIEVVGRKMVRNLWSENGFRFIR